MPSNGPRASAAEIQEMDPYSFFAAMGKKVVRPGGGRSTQQLFDMAAIRPTDHVLDAGCGVGATGIEMVERFGCRVTLIDKSEFMVAEARKNVAAAGMQHRITVEEADILKLPYADDTFDVSIVEAVTMFVPRFMAVREVVRVTKPEGRIVDQELCWRGAPDQRALEVLHQPNFCPSIDFDDVRNWTSLFEQCGVRDIRTATGPFYLIHPAHFVADEGIANTARIIGRAVSRPAYLRKSAWFMQNVVRIMPKCGYIVIGGVKPAAVEPA